MNNSGHTAAPDASLLARVQQCNQPQIIGKLLHDLRNPVHSVRIAMELFARLVAPDADLSALLGRASRYVPPAQAAVTALFRQTQRLTTWLQPPTAPAPRAVPVNEWLEEISQLLGESAGAQPASVRSSLSDDVQLLADPPRLNHAVLCWCLIYTEAAAFSAAMEEEGRVRIEVEYRPQPGERREHCSPAELQALIESAGGRWRLAERRLALSFARAP